LRLTKERETGPIPSLTTRSPLTPRGVPATRGPRSQAGAERLTSTVVVDLNAHAVDRLQLPRPVHVRLAGIGANSLGQSVQARHLLVSDLLGVSGRQAAQRPQESLLGVGGAVKSQISADPSVSPPLSAKPQDLIINGVGRLRHGGTS